MLYFTLTVAISSDDAWEQLSNAGVTPLFSEEEEESINIVVAVERPVEWKGRFPFVIAVAPFESMEIDWEEEWKRHCSLYRDDGFVHVDLGNYGSQGEVLLRPGPGFGDMTHPTTRLVLKMMASSVPGRYVVDIGSGSGILSLAAIAMGAKSVVGVEINDEAIVHAYENAKVNGMEGKVRFCLPEAFSVEGVDDVVVLMNMIMSEQEVAWENLDQLHAIPGECLVSGIIEEGKEEYLALASRWGWTLVDTIHHGDWIGMRFVRR
ncbi:MAG: 50S ribosomal protein L11 methyltransferase [Chlamydiales bacterium]|nr:50S ribosomal protein L11 methyltransferase [Chlamydiales bacterium]